MPRKVSHVEDFYIFYEAERQTRMLSSRMVYFLYCAGRMKLKREAHRQHVVGSPITPQ